MLLAGLLIGILFGEMRACRRGRCLLCVLFHRDRPNLPAKENKE
jgi:hypothetical protein